ncbi:MAG: FkbM family methyltransferase [Bacteroidales bacterium]
MLRSIIKKVPFAIRLYAVIRKIFNIDKDDGTQAGELKVIKKLLKKGGPKFLVDIGAHDGTTISNSSYFIKKGWRGILIEPAPKPFHTLEKNYEKNGKVTCLNIACSNTDGYEDFFMGTDGENSMLNTLCKDQNNWFDQARSKDYIKVRVRRIQDILLEYGYPDDFSLLLIDTEGMDYEVLLGLDLKVFKPWVIVTEEYKWNPEKHHSKYKLLKDNNYELFGVVGCNSIWFKRVA